MTLDDVLAFGASSFFVLLGLMPTLGVIILAVSFLVDLWKRWQDGRPL